MILYHFQRNLQHAIYIIWCEWTKQSLCHCMWLSNRTIQFIHVVEIRKTAICLQMHLTNPFTYNHSHIYIYMPQQVTAEHDWSRHCAPLYYGNAHCSQLWNAFDWTSTAAQTQIKCRSHILNGFDVRQSHDMHRAQMLHMSPQNHKH